MKFYTTLSLALSASWVIAHPIDTSRNVEPVDVDKSHAKRTVPYHGFFWKPDSDDQLSKRLQHLGFWWKPVDKADGENGEGIEQRGHPGFWWSNNEEKQEGAGEEGHKFGGKGAEKRGGSAAPHPAFSWNNNEEGEDSAGEEGHKVGGEGVQKRGSPTQHPPFTWKF
ncbi:hypothetical protein FB45DRAFT_354300 [Roridomyces roridus]|uniref:Uncharacterized protein n=1 Tax=Roridomyces roridus TaxID=1738132 RepID=A0AAD7C7G6_9AGAR|nr:hypothetical protein FB45DRAFT_354300 [Roridomyces roridus]